MGHLNNVVTFTLVYLGLKVSHSLNCTFENGFCGWEHDPSGNFNWTKRRGGTPSGLTGPTSDHTTTDGYYVYIETSIPRQSQEKAMLVSPMLEPGSYCLIFWYSMYGQNIGTLNLYMRTRASNSTLIFTRDEQTHCTEWTKGVVSMKSNVRYQIVLEGTVGGAKGDIAVDDITLTVGMCPVYCDFESDFCSWHQGTEDDFDWTRKKDRSPTPNTGPLTGHTEGGEFYIFIETSYPPRQEGEKAKLISPVQEPGSYCLTFWYNINGKHIGHLNVYMISKVGNDTLLLLSRENGTQATEWKKANISYDATSEHELVLVGIRGNGNQGDIAVDDISFSTGQCLQETTSTSIEPHLYLTQAFKGNTNTISATSPKTDVIEETPMITPLDNTTTNINEVYTPVTEDFPPSASTTPQQTKQSTQTIHITPKSLSPASAISSHTTLSTNKSETIIRLSTISARLTESTTEDLQSDEQEISSISPTLNAKMNITTASDLATNDKFASKKATKGMSDVNDTMVMLSNSYNSLTRTSHFTGSPKVLTTLSMTSTTTTLNQSENSTSVKISLSLAIPIALAAITSTLVVLGIAFVCRHRQLWWKHADSRSVQTNDNTDLALGTENAFEDCSANSNSNCQLYISQSQYSDVSFENMQFQDITFIEDTAEEQIHTYSHVQKLEHPILNITYSRLSAVNSNQCYSSEQAITNNSQICQNLSRVTTPLDYGDVDIISRETDFDSRTERYYGDDSEFQYDHIVAGGPPKRKRQPEEYSHLCRNVEKENISYDKHGYARVLKRNDKVGNDVEFKEKGDNSQNSFEPAEQCERENNFDKYVHVLFDVVDDTESNRSSLHDYVLLEKVDNSNTSV